MNRNIGGRGAEKALAARQFAGDERCIGDLLREADGKVKIGVGEVDMAVGQFQLDLQRGIIGGKGRH